MTESKHPYVPDPWSTASGIKPWEDIVAECKVIVLPEMLRPHFAVGDDGKMLVNSTPELVEDERAEDLFLRLWSHLHQLHQCAQIAMGEALVYAQERFGEEFAQALMEYGELSYHTYRQRMSVARHVPPENRDPTVSFSKLRALAPAPPDVQRDLLGKVHAGTLSSSTDVAAERRRIMNLPEPERFAPPTKLGCPICGGSDGWSVDDLQRMECKRHHCKGTELRDHLDALQAAVRCLYSSGDREPLDKYVQTYHVL